ncbi:MAG: hypothetical protein BWY75_03306 [bacterium ADurb.Bin425]|nr:MAG: hypothetical protein BWY75_03306 [bacterium ADurb.Bin425]
MNGIVDASSQTVPENIGTFGPTHRNNGGITAQFLFQFKSFFNGKLVIGAGNKTNTGKVDILFAISNRYFGFRVRHGFHTYGNLQGPVS